MRGGRKGCSHSKDLCSVVACCLLQMLLLLQLQLLLRSMRGLSVNVSICLSVYADSAQK